MNDDTPDPRRSAPWCLDQDTNFRLARQRSHCPDAQGVDISQLGQSWTWIGLDHDFQETLWSGLDMVAWLWPLFFLYL